MREGKVVMLTPQPRTPTSGERLRALRLQAGLTQEQLAIRIGIDARQLRRWELDEVPMAALDAYLLLEELSGKVTGKAA